VKPSIIIISIIIINKKTRQNLQKSAQTYIVNGHTLANCSIAHLLLALLHSDLAVVVAVVEAAAVVAVKAIALLLQGARVQHWLHPLLHSLCICHRT
jgi:hypothetical protein